MNKATERIQGLIALYPNDYVVIGYNACNDFFISEPFTYYEQAKKEHSRLLDLLNIDFKVSIKNLNVDCLKFVGGVQ